MAVQTMEDLFLHVLKDIYYAEKEIVKALPKMAKAVEFDELKNAFETHLEETKEQVKRLETVFENCGEKAKGEKCEAIEGLIEEGEEAMKETKDKDVLAAALIAGAQAVEHYEISRYGTLCAWAKELGFDDSLELLLETLEEEKKTDALLTDLAKQRINKQAA